MIRVVTTNDVKRLGTILSVWAHPDDESFLAAGVLTTAVQNGQSVVCVTATKGEAGSQDVLRWPLDTLGEVRAAELRCALDILGIRQHYWLNYKDGCCCDAPQEKAVAKLRRIIKKTQPDTILTFGPDGWTGHDDHRTMYEWVMKAVQGSDKKIDVFCVVHTPDHYQKYFKPADEALNIFFNIDMPPLIPAEQCDIYFELPADICQKKCAALAAAPSQTDVLFKQLEPGFVLEAFSSECFVRAK